MKLNKLYELRKDFTIIGLTGRTGSGCTKFANLLAKPSFEEVREISYFREPNSDFFPESKRDFKHVYRHVYDYCKNNWQRFKIIKYRDVLYMLLLIDYSNRDREKMKSLISNIFINNNEEVLGVNEVLKVLNNCHEKIKGCALNSIYEGIIKSTETNKSFINNIRELYEKLKSTDAFNILDENIKDIDFQGRIHLLHYLSCHYRAHGFKVDETSRHSVAKSDVNIYFIAKFINYLIKSQRKDRRGSKVASKIVIDSLRNSMEIMFFKERYAAFYMAAVKGERRQLRLKNRLNEEKKDHKKTNFLLNVDDTEYKSNDFKKGWLGSPDVQNCIAQSDIHIFNSDESSWVQKGELTEEYKRFFNRGGHDSNKAIFSTMAEQALKLVSLIGQPGLITPSPLERCMQVAYSSKLNSGCISRQVGAVVTDENFAIKAIGWNDVPSGATPCKYRNVNDLIKGENKDIFTDYEKGEAYLEYEESPHANLEPDRHLKSDESEKFHEYLKNTYRGIDNEMDGKPCSFCFKSTYNKFKGENNQVHTRSLHAEENAMLQISKKGGVGINKGKLFTTASPCELCAKKAYQLGINEIYYIDPYPGISRQHIFANNNDTDPKMHFFQGFVGRSFHKLYEPFMAYKDEVNLISNKKPKDSAISKRELLNSMLTKDSEKKIITKIQEISEGEIDEILEKIGKDLENKLKSK